MLSPRCLLAGGSQEFRRSQRAIHRRGIRFSDLTECTLFLGFRPSPILSGDIRYLAVEYPPLVRQLDGNPTRVPAHLTGAALPCRSGVVAR